MLKMHSRFARQGFVMKRRRYEHRRLNEHGQCVRCGLGPNLARFCPPGFWMTKAEWAEWEAVVRDGSQYEKYASLERKWRTAESNSTEQH